MKLKREGFSLLFALTIFLQLNGQEKPIPDLEIDRNKKYHFYLRKEYRQIKFNVEFQIDEPLDSIKIDTLGYLSLIEFKQKHPKLDSIQFFSEKAIAYKWFHKDYLSENELKWNELSISNIRRSIKRKEIFERIDKILLATWKPYEPAYEVVNSDYSIELTLVLDIGEDMGYPSYYVFDMQKGTVDGFVKLDEGGVQHLRLKKNTQYLVVLLEVKEDKVLCARRYVNINQPEEIKLSFKEVPLNELETCFKIN